mmetsp:Transcript_6414/g.16362  ORF Transcript_6414/g.16362 Transcript_6414/m.16362 type:complete len:351 (-) Transcript_6414:671-1723(-)
MPSHTIMTTPRDPWLYVTGPSEGVSSLLGSSSPRSSSRPSLLLQPSLTLTPRSRNTGRPRKVSMSRRAAVDSSLSARPSLPMMMPIWLLRSTYTLARMRSFLRPSRSVWLCTHTCVLYGTSCAYFRKIFSRMISAMKKRSGCSLMASLGYSVGPSGSRSSAHSCTLLCPTPASALMGNTRSTPGCASNHVLSSRISSSCSRSHLLRMTPMGAGFCRPGGTSPSQLPMGSRMASTMTSMTSALAMALRTDRSIMASSLLNSSCMIPGVSSSTIWKSSSDTMPRMRWRVVCGLCVTMLSLVPTSWFSSVLLPALGRPTMATYPLLCPAGSPLSISPPMGGSRSSTFTSSSSS